MTNIKIRKLLEKNLKKYSFQIKGDRLYDNKNKIIIDKKSLTTTSYNKTINSNLSSQL